MFRNLGVSTIFLALGVIVFADWFGKKSSPFGIRTMAAACDCVLLLAWLEQVYY
jgi:hypothetical protein